MTHGLDLTPTDEFDASDWSTMTAAALGLTRKPRVHHDRSCDGKCWGVFRCSAPGMRFACGRWVGACVGGSDDNRCADCWCRAQRVIRSSIMKLLRGAAWRSERRICILLMGEDEAPLVVDALFELVREEKIEWFGAEGRGDEPLKYRLRRAA